MWYQRLIGLVVALVIAGCLYGGWRSFEPTVGQAATASEAPISRLPASAKNVRYYLPGAFGPVTYYEFEVSEEDFEAWVAAMPPPQLARVDWRTIQCLDDEGRPSEERELEDGIVYHWREDDASIQTAYDRVAGRAYFRSNSR